MPSIISARACPASTVTAMEAMATVMAMATAATVTERKNKQKRHQRALQKGIFAMPSDMFPAGNVTYFLRKCDILLSQCDICLAACEGILSGSLNFKDDIRPDVVLSFTFSKKIFHRRSLFRTPTGVYHRFAKQIYITACWAYPYAQHAKIGSFLYFCLWLGERYFIMEEIENGEALPC